MSSSDDAPSSTPSTSSGSMSPGWHDIKIAASTIQPTKDIKTVGEIPCARESLMYGIVSGFSIGAVRALNSNVRVAANWTVGTFMIVTLATWTVCRTKRDNDLAMTRMIAERYPERNIRVAVQKAEERRMQMRAGVNEPMLDNTEDITLSRVNATTPTPAIPKQDSNSWWAWPGWGGKKP